MFILVFACFGFVASNIQATSLQDNLQKAGGTAYYNDATKLPSETDPTNIIGDIIKIALGFLGLIFVILILWSGYQWMTAGGNTDTVTAAKKRIINAVIGLLIVLAAYIIADFIISRAAEVTTGTKIVK